MKVAHSPFTSFTDAADGAARTLHRRWILRAGAALGTGLFLPRIQACDFTTSTLRVTHPWTRATAPDAAFAVVCMKFDEVIDSDRLISVRCPIAENADMGGTGAGPVVDFPIPAGQDTYLDESTTYVRLVGLKFALEAGRSYPLQLGFEKGGMHTTTLSVDFTRFK